MSDYSEYLKRPAKAGKGIKIVIWLLTAAVLILVGLMRQYKFDVGIDFSFLPPVHALLNTLVAFCLIVAVMMIKKKNVKAHKAWIGLAMLCSVLFLLCYVAYHFTVEETLYTGQGAMRYVYFFFLITHIVLAGVSLPFILYTWMYGFTNQFEKHKKMARWVFPVWLYVAVTGPICYLLFKPYY